MLEKEIWIQEAQARLILGGQSEGPDASWRCWSPFEEGIEGDRPCRRCDWFDTKDRDRVLATQRLPQHPRQKDRTEAAVHADYNVTLEGCLDGTFMDSEDTRAWLRRDKLVHRGRYAAICAPDFLEPLEPELSLASRVAAAFCFLSITLFCLCACLRRPRGKGERGSGGRRTPSSGSDEDPSTRRQAPPSAEAHWEPAAVAARRKDACSASLSREPSAGEAALHPPPSPEHIISDLHEELVEAADLPQAERKQLFRRHLRQWHPDKNPVQLQETATQVLQFLNEQRLWFLSDAAIPEAASLLPPRGAGA